MIANSLASLVDQTRGELQQVREWLLRPTADTMSACVPSLERANACLQEVSRLVQPGVQPAPLNEALSSLVNDVREVHALLQAAGQIYFGAMQRLSKPAASDPQQPDPPAPLSTLG